MTLFCIVISVLALSESFCIFFLVQKLNELRDRVESLKERSGRLWARVTRINRIREADLLEPSKAQLFFSELQDYMGEDEYGEKYLDVLKQES